MSRYSDRDIAHSLFNKEKERNRIDLLKTTDYENSILYSTDVLQNEKCLNDVIGKIDSLSNYTTDTINFANNSKTSFKETLELLNSIPGIVSLMMDEANSVRQKIYDASKLVFDEQLLIYNNNNEIIDDIIYKINDDMEKYKSYIDNYLKFKNIYNNLTDDDPNKSQYGSRYRDYKQLAENYINDAERKLSDLSNKISENADIINTFLKTNA